MMSRGQLMAQLGKENYRRSLPAPDDTVDHESSESSLSDISIDFEKNDLLKELMSTLETENIPPVNLTETSNSQQFVGLGPLTELQPVNLTDMPYTSSASQQRENELVYVEEDTHCDRTQLILNYYDDDCVVEINENRMGQSYMNSEHIPEAGPSQKQVNNQNLTEDELENNDGQTHAENIGMEIVEADNVHPREITELGTGTQTGVEIEIMMDYIGEVENEHERHTIDEAQVPETVANEVEIENEEMANVSEIVANEVEIENEEHANVSEIVANEVEIENEEQANVSEIVTNEVEIENEEHANVSEGHVRQKGQKKVKCVVNRTKNKILRMQGQSYKGIEKIAGRYVQSRQRPERKVGATCKSTFCQNTPKRKCSAISEDQRQQIFTTFWKKMDWDQRKVYVRSLIKVSAKKAKTSPCSKREDSFFYYLNVNNEHIPVCKKMFCSTLGVKMTMVRDWIKGDITSSMYTKQPQKKRKDSDPKRLSARTFLETLPTVPSHYCRKSSSKTYIEPIIPSMSKLYDLYIAHCRKNNCIIASRFVLRDEFKKKNMSLYKPSKDECDICTAHKSGNISEADYNAHITRKVKAQKEMENDISKAEKHVATKVFTMDLQAVLLCPKLRASAVYFKTKLGCHNFTIYDCNSADVICYFWTEVEGDLTANSFASCIVDHVRTVDADTVIIWSDGCGYQNRSSMLANALLHEALKTGKTIIQKYLERGHTHMKCDSCHATVERTLRNRQIYVPSMYIDAIQEARKQKPYAVKEVDHTFFKDYTGLQYCASIRPGIKPGDPQVHDIRALKYDENGISYKLDMDDEWSLLPRRLRFGYTDKDIGDKTQCKIKARKFKDLQDLKKVMPKEYHPYYDSLPHSK